MDADTGEPVTGKTVMAWFEHRKLFGPNKTDYPEKVTDSNGMCSFSGSSDYSIGCLMLPDENWYRCQHEIHFTGVSRLMFNRLLPDNQVVTMAVQRVIHPIPLHVMEIYDDVGVDSFGKGNNILKYDMLACDWLPPRGTGVVSDVVFERLPPKYVRTTDAGPYRPKTDLYSQEMRVSFPGEGNGIVEMAPLEDSSLALRTAPENGYVSAVTAWTGYGGERGGPTNSWSGAQVYCFRIRSKLDANGVPSQGYYGKIYHGLEGVYSGDESVPIGGVRMFYYVNPTNLDRNLEWDTRTNLNKKIDYLSSEWP